MTGHTPSFNWHRPRNNSLYVVALSVQGGACEAWSVERLAVSAAEQRASTEVRSEEIIW